MIRSNSHFDVERLALTNLGWRNDFSDLNFWFVTRWQWNRTDRDFCARCGLYRITQSLTTIAKQHDVRHVTWRNGSHCGLDG